MQDYRNHAPSGIVSLFGRGGGPFRIELSFFGIFNMYRLSFQKNALKKFWTKFSLYDYLLGSISESFFRYRYSVIPSFGNLRGLIFL